MPRISLANAVVGLNYYLNLNHPGLDWISPGEVAWGASSGWRLLLARAVKTSIRKINCSKKKGKVGPILLLKKNIKIVFTFFTTKKSASVQIYLSPGPRPAPAPPGPGGVMSPKLEVIPPN